MNLESRDVGRESDRLSHSRALSLVAPSKVTFDFFCSGELSRRIAPRVVLFPVLVPVPGSG